MGKDQSTENASYEAFVSAATESDGDRLVEVNTYVREDQAFALEIIQNAERQRGRIRGQAELFQEGLDLLIAKHLVALRLRKNRPSRELEGQE